jgi:hypothetical protein
MKRLVFPLLVAGALIVLGAGVAVAASSTTRTVSNENYSFTDTANCPPEVLEWHGQGSFKVTDYYDTGGTLVKEITTNTGGPFTITVTNTANGKTAITRSQTDVIITRYNPDGSVSGQRFNGVILHFNMPGGGVLAMDVGTVWFDSQGNVVRIGGPHQFLTGDLAEFCAALS